MRDALAADVTSPARGGSAAIELRNVWKSFADSTALEDVSLDIAPGEFFSLLGPSGCGKSTTLNLIGGFETPTRGDVLIGGQPVAHVPPFERPVNTVFQSYALFPHMTVAENVEFGPRMKGVGRAERKAAAADMLRMVSLAGYEGRRPAQLSGGQRQRVALARALVNRPSVLLLDEPLGALDLKLRKQMQIELTRLQRQVGITFVYVTHDQEEAMAMSDRIAVMDRGRLLQVGSPDEIYEHPKHRFVMDFIGAANSFDGTLARRSGQIGEVEIAGVGRMHGRIVGDLNENSRVALLVRPEKMRLSPATGTTHEPAIAGELAHTSRLGFVTHYTIRLAQGPDVLCYRLNDRGEQPATSISEGTRVSLSWGEEEARIFPLDREA